MPGTQRLLQSGAVGGFPFGREFGGRDVSRAAVDGDRWHVIPSRQVGRRKRTIPERRATYYFAADAPPPQDQDPARRQPRRDRHPRHARRARAGHHDRRDLLAGGPLRAAPLQGGREPTWSARARSRSRPTSTSTTSSASRANAGVDAIHPGYGFLSENPDVRRGLRAAPASLFIGPTPGDHAHARQQGGRARARDVGRRAGDAGDAAAAAGRCRRCCELAAAVGYPADAQGELGRRRARHARDRRRRRNCSSMVAAARREAQAAFGNDEVYLEKLVRRARHVEVQILGDTHGNLVHLYERDCTVQRRNQKVVERAPAPYLDDAQRASCASCGAAHRRAPSATLNAGTVEFLHGRRHRPVLLHRGQPAHPGRAHGDRGGHRHRHRQGADPHRRRRRDRHARERRAARRRTSASTATRCSAASPPKTRRTTSSPTTAASPPIAAPAGFGIRLDGGTAYSGAVITPFYDSLLVKVTAWAPTPDEAIARMDRALREFRIRGVTTNLRFLENVDHPPALPSTARTPRASSTRRRSCSASAQARPRDATAALPRDVIVNGNPEVQRPRAVRAASLRRRVPPQLPVGAPTARHAAAARRAGRREVRGVDAASSRRCCSPTPRCATPTSRCWPRACARATWSPIAPAYARLAAASCSRSNAGAARPSTSRCASCRKTRGSGWRAARGDAEPAAADAAARRQRRRLHQLSRQRRALLRAAGRARPASTCSASSIR